MAEPFTTEELQERVRNTAWMVENHSPDAEMNVPVQELDRLVSAAAKVARLEMALPAIIFALRYDDLGDEDWMSWERSLQRWEEHWKPALEQEHFGDCIKQPCSCFRCQAEDCIRVAKLIEEGLKDG